MISCSAGRCALQGPMTIANAQALLEEGVRTLGDKEVTVDLAGVTEVDSTGVSLLLEWRRRAVSEKRVIRYVNLPPNLKSLAELYGVTELLGQEKGAGS